MEFNQLKKIGLIEIELKIGNKIPTNNLSCS
jgi:hypothetical protein